MSLLNKFLPKKEEKEYFLTVGIEESRITATVSLISGKEVTIVGSGISEFDETSEETEAADIAISAAEKKIGGNILVQKVIFGLPLSLIENDKIKPQHLSKLKKITKVLSLIPCGFIEYPQALSYYLETKEESPPTLLLISVGKKQVTISHIRVGKIEKNITVEKTSSITSDFEKSLAEFSASDEILPSRIMLYDESGETKLDEIREELLRFPWHKHSIFLHTPKIESFETTALTYALVEAAARSLTKELHLEETEVIKDATPEKEKGLEETKVLENAENFGFVKDRDIALTEELPVTKEVQQTENQQMTEESAAENIPTAPQESIFAKLPRMKFSLPQLPAFKFPIISLGISIFLVLAFILFAFWYYPKSAVNLIVYSASSASQTDVLFTTNTDNMKNKNSILATSVSSDVSGNKSASTTGSTKIGEKSTGFVTIYNKTLGSKTFPKGTVLAANGFKFTLNADVTIASASDTGEGLTFGKVTSDITAADIGPDSNLAAGTNFTFNNLDQSSFYAKNTDKMSGGTSRDITSVSKDDQDKLLTSLTQDLTSQAKQQLMQKLAADEKLLDVSLDNSITSKKFSKNVGEEAKDLSLTLELKVSGLIYKQQDLTNLTHDSQTQPPPGFAGDSNSASIHIDDAKIDKNGDVVASATIIYYFLPQIDTDKVKSAILGKTFGQADTYLQTIRNIGGVEIVNNTKLPLLSGRLPIRRENIDVSLVSR